MSADVYYGSGQSVALSRLGFVKQAGPKWDAVRDAVGSKPSGPPGKWQQLVDAFTGKTHSRARDVEHTLDERMHERFVWNPKTPDPIPDYPNYPRWHPNYRVHQQRLKKYEREDAVRDELQTRSWNQQDKIRDSNLSLLQRHRDAVRRSQNTRETRDALQTVGGGVAGALIAGAGVAATKGVKKLMQMRAARKAAQQPAKMPSPNAPAYHEPLPKPTVSYHGEHQ